MKKPRVRSILCMFFILNLLFFGTYIHYKFSIYYVRGSSMFPAMKNEQIWITKGRFFKPERRDIVCVYRNKKILCKRIVGMPGDKITLNGNVVYINDKIIDEPGIVLNGFQKVPRTITIPEGHYFIMGDNRPHSLDSKIFGPVSIGFIVDELWFRIW